MFCGQSHFYTTVTRKMVDLCQGRHFTGKRRCLTSIQVLDHCLQAESSIAYGSRIFTAVRGVRESCRHCFC